MVTISTLTNFQSGLTKAVGRPKIKAVEPSYTGQRIKELRAEKGISLYRLSDLTEEVGGYRIRPQSINAIERGESQNPGRRLLRPIAKALGVSIASLFEGEEEMAGAIP